MFKNYFSNATRTYWKIKPYEIVALILGLVLFFLISRVNSRLYEMTTVGAVEAMMFRGYEWELFLTELGELDWYVKGVFSWYHKYLVITTFFLVCYSIVLFYLRRVMIRHIGGIESPGYSEKVARYFIPSFTIAAVLLITCHLVQNISLLIFEQTVPLATALKMTAFLVAVLVFMIYFLGRIVAFTRLLRQTLWSCRFSLIGIILTLLFLQIGQGKEMMIYMLESWSFIALMLFQLLLIFAGVLFLYMPRFFYPDNPEETYHWRLLFQYAPWTTHLKGLQKWDDKGYLTDLDENYSTSIAQHREEQKIEAYLSNFVGKTARSGAKGGNLSSIWYGRIRKWTPALLVGIYFLGLALFYFDLFTDIMGSMLNDRTSLMVELYRPFYFKIGIQLVLLIVVAYLLFHWTKAEKYIWKRKNVKSWKTVLHFALMIVGILLPVFLFLCMWSEWYMGRNVDSFSSVFWVDHSLGLAGVVLVILMYYIINVFVAYKGNLPEQKSYGLTALILLIVAAVVISTTIDNNHFDLRSRPGHETYLNQNELDDMIAQFKRELPAPVDSSGRTPVFFIAANGGGTTQAYWTATLLSYLRQNTDDRFGRHVFAMSGASGGAVGLGVSTLLWDQSAPEFDESIQLLYKRDFLSGGLVRMLTTDTWLTFLPFDFEDCPNRNTWLYDKYRIALDRVDGGAQWDKPFMEAYNENKWRPIYMANTSRVEDGERFYVAPVGVPSTGGNMLKALDEKGLKLSNITFGQAVMLTNRFPFLNSAGKIDGIGHFVDGGYHDNSGIESLMELYHASKGYFDPGEYEIIFIHINYGNGWEDYHPWDGCTEYGDLVYPRNTNEFLVPVSSLVNNLLGGLVRNRVQSIPISGHRLVSFYLPNLPQLIRPPAGCEERYTDEFNELRQNVKLKWVNNAIGRTVSGNHHEYVKTVLGISTMQPGTSVHQLIDEINTCCE